MIDPLSALAIWCFVGYAAAIAAIWSDYDRRTPITSHDRHIICHCMVLGPIAVMMLCVVMVNRIVIYYQDR